MAAGRSVVHGLRQAVEGRIAHGARRSCRPTCRIPNYWPYLIALLCSILMAYAIARLVGGSETHGLFRGNTRRHLVGLAAAVAMITEMVFEIRAGSFILISAAYPFLGCILMGIIIGAWKPKQERRARTIGIGSETMKIEGKIVKDYREGAHRSGPAPGPRGERYIELFRHGTLTRRIVCAARKRSANTAYSR